MSDEIMTRLGRIEGLLEAHIRADDIAHQELDNLKKRVEKVENFSAKVVGAAVGVPALIASFVSFLYNFVSKGH